MTATHAFRSRPAIAGESSTAAVAYSGDIQPILSETWFSLSLPRLGTAPSLIAVSIIAIVALFIQPSIAYQRLN